MQKCGRGLIILVPLVYYYGHALFVSVMQSFNKFGDIQAFY